MAAGDARPNGMDLMELAIARHPASQLDCGGGGFLKKAFPTGAFRGPIQAMADSAPRWLPPIKKSAGNVLSLAAASPWPYLLPRYLVHNLLQPIPMQIDRKRLLIGDRPGFGGGTGFHGHRSLD